MVDRKWKMNVLHTVASLDPSTGGPASSVPGLTRALTTFGAKVALRVNQAPKAEWIESLQDSGIEVFNGELGALPLSWQSPNLIHDHGIWLPANHQVAIYARERSIPRMVSPRGMLEPWAMRYKRWKKRVAWWLYQGRDLRTCAALHATAKMEARQFHGLGLLNPVCVLPNGVELPEAASHISGVSGQTSVVGGQERKVVLFLSRIHPKKGLVNLLHAWANLQRSEVRGQRSEKWVLAIAGWDEDGHEGDLKRLATEMGIQWEDARSNKREDSHPQPLSAPTGEGGALETGEGSTSPSSIFRLLSSKAISVVFLGPLRGSAREEAFRQADLFVLPSFSENFGIAVAEALGRGLPVITTRGCPWEDLEIERCGWWVEPDVSSLSIALREAIASTEEERCKMGQRGRRLIETKYTWPRVAEQMCTVYQWLLGKGKKPACVV
jgi:glycosyltransferase involved in cell wall biosynthesis